MLATLLLLLPLSPIQRDTAPVVELNTMYDEAGAEVLEQVIWWGPEAVVDWRLAVRAGAPEYDHARKCWRNIWIDGDTIRVVTATAYKRSHTQCYDPEIADRERVPKDERRGLR